MKFKPRQCKCGCGSELSIDFKKDNVIFAISYDNISPQSIVLSEAQIDAVYDYIQERYYQLRRKSEGSLYKEVA